MAIPGGISTLSRTSPVSGSTRRKSLSLVFIGGVPELSIHPGDPGDEAVGLDGAKDRSGLGIDLVDLAVAILTHPERPFRPGQARAAARGRGDGRDHSTGLRIDLLDAVAGELEEMRPSKAVRMCWDIDGAHVFPLAGSSAFNVSPAANQTFCPSKVTPATWSPGKGAILTDDLGIGAAHSSSLVNRQRGWEQQSRRESEHRRSDPSTGTGTAERLDFAGDCQRVEGPLYGALARSHRQGEGRTRPGFAIRQEGKHAGMLVLNGPRQNNHLASVAGLQSKAALVALDPAK